MAEKKEKIGDGKQEPYKVLAVFDTVNAGTLKKNSRGSSNLNSFKKGSNSEFSKLIALKSKSFKAYGVPKYQDTTNASSFCFKVSLPPLSELQNDRAVMTTIQATPKTTPVASTPLSTLSTSLTTTTSTTLAAALLKAEKTLDSIKKEEHLLSIQTKEWSDFMPLTTFHSIKDETNIEKQNLKRPVGVLVIMDNVQRTMMLPSVYLNSTTKQLGVKVDNYAMQKLFGTGSWLDRPTSVVEALKIKPNAGKYLTKLMLFDARLTPTGDKVFPFAVVTDAATGALHFTIINEGSEKQVKKIME